MSVRRLRSSGVLLSLLLVVAAGGACTSHPRGTGPALPTTTTSAAATSDPGSSALAGGDGESGAPPSTIMTTPTPGLSSRTGAEIDKPCPYASTDDFRDAEGDRTVHSVELAGTPVGCRYYFEYDPSTVIGEIRIQTFATSTEAFNAMVTAAKGHPEAYGDKTIGDGAVLLKLPLQGIDAWACVFAKGRSVITAQTRQTAVAQDAKNVAVLIEPKVP